VNVVLASGSAVRRKLLAAAGLVFTVDPADVDETIAGGTTAARAAALAERKALHVAARSGDALVIGSDSIGSFDDEHELHKPTDVDDAVAQLLAMAGRTHAFASAACVARGPIVLARVVETARVTFRTFGEDEARAYAALDEWRGSAGGYHVEDRGALLVERIEGPLHAVQGLPLLPLLGALRAAGAFG
jgi:septum formation protein